MRKVIEIETNSALWRAWEIAQEEQSYADTSKEYEAERRVLVERDAKHSEMEALNQKYQQLWDHQRQIEYGRHRREQAEIEHIVRVSHHNRYNTNPNASLVLMFEIQATFGNPRDSKYAKEQLEMLAANPFYR